MALRELTTIKRIGELALKGKSDEEIAADVNKSVYTVMVSRRALGIRRRLFLDIIKDWKKASSINSSPRLEFSISRVYMEDLGLDPDKEYSDISFKGKIQNKKLILTIKGA